MADNAPQPGPGSYSLPYTPVPPAYDDVWLGAPADFVGNYEDIAWNRTGWEAASHILTDISERVGKLESYAFKNDWFQEFLDVHHTTADRMRALAQEGQAVADKINTMLGVGVDMYRELERSSSRAVKKIDGQAR